jgi:hypothetical protein
VKHFNDGKRCTTDLPCCSQTRTTSTECSKQKVKVITKDQKVTVKKIMAQLGTIHSAAQEMIMTSGHWKVNCHSVPQLLIDEHKRALASKTM